MARRDVAFDAEGVTLRGWFYPAEGRPGLAPAIVMAHGFSAVKEMYLDSFAEVFGAAGLNVLVFDNRNFGASDGEPRQEIDPVAQVRDYRHAITWACGLPEVDPLRIGIWGSSYSGGHVLVVATADRRVKAVVSQVPVISGSANLRALVRADSSRGCVHPSTPIVRRGTAGRPRHCCLLYPKTCSIPHPCLPRTPGPGLPRPPSCVLRHGGTRSPCAASRCSPSTIPLISPTPLLLIPAREDHLTPAHLAIDAYEKALEPKKLVILPGGHFDAYVSGFEAASGAASDWFSQHLLH